MKILLLNPPGKKLYVRDYYCSSTSKASYLFQPLDLIYMSGLLRKEHELEVLDCILKKMNCEVARQEIVAINPGAVIAMTGSVSWEEDQIFFEKLKNQLPDIKLLLNGDLFFDNPVQFLEKFAFIDGITLDFVTDSVNDFLRGDFDNLGNFAYRKDNKVYKTPNRLKNILTLGLPTHELFIDAGYQFPFARYHPFATVLTNYGCPFKCNFCVAAEMALRYRPLVEIVRELDELEKLGIKEIFFKDFTFGLPKRQTGELLATMHKKHKFSWSCYSRVDVLDHEVLKLMKLAGCHTIIFGVESGSSRILKAQNKGFRRAAVLKCFSLARAVGIDTVATFVLGLPQDNYKSILKTIRFARKLDCDFASFNVAVPRTGTPMRESAIKDGLINSEQIAFDHSGEDIAMATHFLNRDTLKKLRSKAIMDFYFRIKYLLKRIRKIQSLSQLKLQLQMAWALLKSA
ncbi:B12-binding domain-containing radical SAM protein [Candidatus Riflebacteria bacterium]